MGGGLPACRARGRDNKEESENETEVKGKIAFVSCSGFRLVNVLCVCVEWFSVFPLGGYCRLRFVNCLREFVLPQRQNLLGGFQTGNR